MFKITLCILVVALAADVSSAFAQASARRMGMSAQSATGLGLVVRAESISLANGAAEVWRQVALDRGPAEFVTIEFRKFFIEGAGKISSVFGAEFCASAPATYY